jgi:hypothetical protein
MAVTAHVFPQWAIGNGIGDIAMTGGTYKVALSNTAGPVALSTSGVSTAKLFTDWTSNVATEITGTGYTAGGATVSSPTYTAGGTNNSVATWTSASNPSWTGASFTANQAIWYESSASTYQLICFWDFGGAVTVTSSTFTLTISGSGLLTVTAS